MAHSKQAVIKIERDAGTISKAVFETRGTAEHVLGVLMESGKDFGQFLRTDDGSIVITLTVEKVPFSVGDS